MNGWAKTAEAAIDEYQLLRAMMVPPNPFLEFHEPRRPQIFSWPMAPIQTAVWALLQPHIARLYPCPTPPDWSPWIDLMVMEGDIAAFVRDHDDAEVTLQGIRTLAGAR